MKGGLNSFCLFVCIKSLRFLYCIEAVKSGGEGIFHGGGRGGRRKGVSIPLSIYLSIYKLKTNGAYFISTGEGDNIKICGSIYTPVLVWWPETPAECAGQGRSPLRRGLRYSSGNKSQSLILLPTFSSG